MYLCVCVCVCVCVWLIQRRFHYRDYVALDVRMINELWTGMDLEVRGSCLTAVLSRHLPGDTEVNTTYHSQGSLCPGRDSNRSPPKYKYRALYLNQSIRLGLFNPLYSITPYFKFLVILYSHLHLDLASAVFPWAFRTKMYSFLHGCHLFHNSYPL
jgi:hypothetical protein